MNIIITVYYVDFPIKPLAKGSTIFAKKMSKEFSLNFIDIMINHAWYGFTK